MARFLLVVLVVMVFVLLVRSCTSTQGSSTSPPITIIEQLPPPTTRPSTAASTPTSTQPTQTVTPTQDERHGAPATAEEVAGEFGGDPSQWSRGPDEYGRTVGPNGWVFRSFGRRYLAFTVPDGCVVDTPTGRKYPGDVAQTTDLTIYWGWS